MDRSIEFHKAVFAAHREGMSIEDFVRIASENLQGCASKYENRLHAETIRSFAKAEFWASQTVKLDYVSPYYVQPTKDILEARDYLSSVLHNIIVADIWWGHSQSDIDSTVDLEIDAEQHPNFFDPEDLSNDFQWRQRAIRVSPGVGKTTAVTQAIAQASSKRFLYTVPTIRLAEEICEKHLKLDIHTRVFRGRSADDPDNPPNKMCLDLTAVELAVDLGLDVAESCCSGKDPDGNVVKCAFYAECGYNRQFDDEPRVWIAAHNILFHEQKRFGKVDFVVIDETFWSRGIGDLQKLTVDFIEQNVDPRSELATLRTKLAEALRIAGSSGEGCVTYKQLVQVGLEDFNCDYAIKLEWKSISHERIIWPNMPLTRRLAALRSEPVAKHVKTLINVWKAAGDLLSHGRRRPDIASGRLKIGYDDSKHGKPLVVGVQDLRRVVKRWSGAPTIIMDATLPDLKLLRPFYDNLEMAADIDVMMPHVKVRQVIGAPVSSKKLSSSERNPLAILRALLARHVELDRPNSLVICQKKLEGWLIGRLPGNFGIAHFNNISGLDEYKNVQVIYLIGRTLPNIVHVESHAGIITGLAPLKTNKPEKGPRWYHKVVRGISCRDRRVVPVRVDIHPDHIAEECRWQITEGELLQAIGRGRGVNRTASEPLRVEIWSDLVLPIVVDDVTQWRDLPSAEGIEMLVDGVVLERPVDMSTCWPEVWATPAAASEWRREIPSLPLERYSAHAIYQRSGNGQKKWKVSYDPKIIADIRSWLEKRLGSLSYCRLET